MINGLMSKNLGHRADHYTETRCRRVTKNPPTTIISASDEGSGTAVVVPPVGTPLMIFKVPEPPAPSNSSSLKTKAKRFWPAGIRLPPSSAEVDEVGRTPSRSVKSYLCQTLTR